MRNATLSNVERPTQDWTLSRLEKHASAHVSAASAFGRKSLVHHWLFGESLAFIKKLKRGRGEWMRWVKASAYSYSTCNNAIKLHEGIPFEALESCEGLNSTDLKVMLGIIKRPSVSRKQKQAHTETATVADRQTNYERPDHKLAKTTPLGIFDGGNQGDEQPAIATPEQAPEVSAAPKQDAAEAKTETPAQKITLVTAMEYMHRINMKLAEVERDLEGVEPDEHLIAQIDVAISTLKRLRGDEATETDAA